MVPLIGALGCSIFESLLTWLEENFCIVRFAADATLKLDRTVGSVMAIPLTLGTLKPFSQVCPEAIGALISQVVELNRVSPQSNQFFPD